jgi:aminoglycoside phosphotransferase (APT) family kinase protein
MVARSQAVVRWLVREQGFPATEPLADTSPVTVDGAVVSFWAYYPQPGPASSPQTSAHLAVLLRLLHDTPPAPVVLPPWIPLTSLQSTAEDTTLSTALTGDERTWILHRISEVREQMAGMEWPLGTGLIHGDAWAGNLLSSSGSSPAGVVLGDWDGVSLGPREVDLIPTWHAAARYGKPPSWTSDFTRKYGYDLAGWDGFPVLMAMRDLVQLNGPIRRAPDSEPHRQVLRQRLDDLRAGRTTTTWKVL